MLSFLKKKIDKRIAFAIIFAAFLGGVLVIWSAYKNLEIEIPLDPVFFPPDHLDSKDQFQGIKKFSSREEFEDFLGKASEFEYLFSDAGFGELQVAGPLPLAREESFLAPERVSETTVQVTGIDEPDIVKTDGKSIYFSQGKIWPIWLWREQMISEEEKSSIYPYPDYPYSELKTKIIKAFPPADLALESEIKITGDLLLIDNILAVFSDQSIFGYDITDPKNPQEKWRIDLEEGNSIVTSRLYKDKIYLVAKNLIDQSRPCPVRPFAFQGKALEIGCHEIYHPIEPIPVDVIFLSLVLDPFSGEVEKEISFVGSSGQSVVYMSEKGIYITYSYQENFVNFFSRFLREKCRDFIPEWVMESLEKLETYEISSQAKFFEMENILQKYQASLGKDERLRIENELTNRMADYYDKEKRKLEKSGILKIGLEDFEISALGSVPGYPLNQFALDEYQGSLRIATTIGERFGWFFRERKSANDVYILDENLKITGSVTDLGLSERIYSARFIEDKGYLVTFREIDPFYVLDLSDARNPQLKGELKIPGYSSYLHPINKDKILGIGMEGWSVKISLFDVSSPESPQEVAKYMLRESWSEVLSNHRAFLMDKKHEIFFLPGSRGGYIFSYKDNNLVLIRAVSGISAKRAIYFDDYLYIVGQEKIIVLDQSSWESVKEFSF